MSGWGQDHQAWGQGTMAISREKDEGAIVSSTLENGGIEKMAPVHLAVR